MHQDHRRGCLRKEKKICRLLDAMSRLFEGVQEIGHQYFVGNCRVSRIRESAACEVEFAGICKHCTYVLASIAKWKKYVSWATGCVLDGAWPDSLAWSAGLLVTSNYPSL